jgi:hypothetical protein
MFVTMCQPSDIPRRKKQRSHTDRHVQLTLSPSMKPDLDGLLSRNVCSDPRYLWKLFPAIFPCRESCTPTTDHQKSARPEQSASKLEIHVLTISR